MPSLPVQVIPAAGIIQITIPTKKGLAVLKITNESANIMHYVDRSGQYGDPIQANYGSVAYHTIEKDRPPNTFWVTGTPADEFAVYFEPEKADEIVK